MKRRLAAILAADVVGYSSLMSKDEARTLAALTEHSAAVFDPAITAQDGRIVKLMGDGVLVEFPSVVQPMHRPRRRTSDPARAPSATFRDRDRTCIASS